MTAVVAPLPVPHPDAGSATGKPWYARLVRGREADAPWVRPAFLALLVGTGLLYIWGLGASGWANSFYSAAVQAGTESWKAFFFGSSDAGNSITVDKTPASLWVMGLSARLFGVNAWSILVPQALEGVATVGVLYLAVRRRFPAWAGLLAGALLALTPVAALMFRFNNPDALLVLLLTVAAYAVLRAQESASTRWLVLAGACVGFGFLAKMLQAFLIVPAFALVYLVCAPVGFWRRVVQLLWSGLALLIAGGWWIAIVELWPESSRPYIGGSQHNSILELTLGYNGLGRLNGNETGSVGGGGRGGGGGGPRGGGGNWGATGWDRLFNAEMGGQISWLLPSALILLAVGLWLTRRAPRTDPARAAIVLWGGWLLITALVFSYMAGIFHAYYNIALAPAIAAVVAMGAALLWERRRVVRAAAVAALTVMVGAWWSYHLLDRTPDWHPWLRHVVLIGGVVGGLGLFGAALTALRGLAPVAAAISVAALLAGPTAYTWDTVSTAKGGSIPSAGPAGMGFGRGGPGGPGGMAGGPRSFQGGPPGQVQGGQPGQGGQPFPGAPGQNGQAPDGTGGTRGQRPTPGNGGAPQGNGGMTPRQGGGMGGGGMGGLLNGSTPGKEIVDTLKRDSDAYTWVAASVGSNSASGYQLATGKPVMPIGGFNGSDPSPTLAEFQKLVTDGRIHYFIGGGAGGMGGGAGGDGMGGGMRSMGGSNASQAIATWVAQSFTATTVGGATLYDLTAPTGNVSDESSSTA
ncbi:glycosyltransferase family 39 protein [Embleya sp. NBC_00888]|uniref:ArnT family glycosyltransferase n=1 Tax=Embleya sp. NBC_00888 TaxID=2975960 RepID=UPI0038650B98|nr:glycosyltransferase family 39 protein [Embleya sp. NBC_00888]